MDLLQSNMTQSDPAYCSFIQALIQLACLCASSPPHHVPNNVFMCYSIDAKEREKNLVSQDLCLCRDLMILRETEPSSVFLYDNYTQT